MIASGTVVLSLEAVNLLSQLAQELANLHAVGGGSLNAIVSDVAEKTQAATAAALDIVGAPTVDVPTVVGAAEAVAAPVVADVAAPVVADVAAPVVADVAAPVAAAVDTVSHAATTVSADVAAVQARVPRAAAA